MSPCCIALLSTLPFASIPMLWGNAKVYISSTCPKWFVICVANALLATGWLVLSVLSLCSEFLPAVLPAPPTLPRLTFRHGDANDEHGDGEGSERAWRQSRSPARKPILAKSVLDQIALSRSSSLERRVKFMDGTVVSAVRTPPRVVTPPSTSNTPSSAEIAENLETPTSDAAEALSTPQPAASSSASAAVESPSRTASARGRKLNFLRLRSSHQLSLSRGRVGSTGTSPERPDQHGVKPGKRASGRGPSMPTKSHSAPVARTNPYEAPYFFPSPLSPEAEGYIDRIRMDRHSPEYQILPLPGSKTIISPPVHIEYAPEAHASTSDGHVSSGEGSVDEEGVLKGPTRRAASFPSPPLGKSRRIRPTSWGSEAPTLDIASFESGAGLPRRRLSRLWRRSAHQMSSLAPLESVVAFDDHEEHLPSLPSPKPELKPRRSWYPPFRHRRSLSDTVHSSVTASGALSDERPKLNRADGADVY